MKKFILLMLLTSAMSAHAVGQASEQIDTNQNEDSDEELNKAIELSLVDQAIEKEREEHKARANTQRNNPVGEMQINTFQRNVQQSNSGFDEDCEEEAIRKAIEKENEEAIEKISKTLTPEEFALNFQNQRSEGEVAPAAPGGGAPTAAQEIPTETTQNTRVIACQNPQNRTYDERGMAEIRNRPYGKQTANSKVPLETIASYLYTDEAILIFSRLKKSSAEHFKNNPLLKIQPVLAFNSNLPQHIADSLLQELSKRKANSIVVNPLVLGPRFNLENTSLTINEALTFKDAPNHVTIAKALQFYYLGRAKSSATAVTMLCRFCFKTINS